MSGKQIKFTLRMAQPHADRIDAKAEKYGFRTRSKFLTEAGLVYGQTAQFDDVMAELADINFALRRLCDAEGTGSVAIPQADVQAMIRDARKLITAAREKLQ